jgi:hypothetical protein
MAHYHLHVSSGSKASGKGAGGHARYLLRVGPYATAREHVQEGATVRVVEIDKTDELIHTESGNMPGWAAHDPIKFWDSSDKYERANGCTYREVEVALPAELSLAQQIALAREFAQSVATVDGGVTPYTLAIHQQDADRPEHRHVHVILSDRIVDGNDRTPETFFQRWNGNDPEKGGARKTEERRDKQRKGETKWTDRLRPLWQTMANEALERAGLDVRIDHRSLNEQRIEQERLADEAKARGDEVAAARHRRQAAILDRPPQPKKGRVLTHAGEEKAPDRAEMMKQYREDMAERQAVIEDLQKAEQELAEIERKEGVLKRAQTRQQEREQADQIKIRDRWNRRKKVRRNRQLDAETAAEQRPGIRHPERPQWQVYRERMLAQAYSEEVAQTLGRWVRVERVEHGIHLHNREMDLTDYGDRIVAGLGGKEREIEAMLQLARAKGWKQIEFTGDEAFRERAGTRALAAGFDLADAALKERIRDQQRQAAERRAAERAAREREAAMWNQYQQERETRPGIRHADRSQWAVDREWVVSRKYDYRHAERAERNGFYSRWMDDEQGLFYERKKDGVRFIDQGALIVAPRDEPYREGAPEVYVLYAQARGWQSIDILGDEAFRLRAARVALEEGLEVSDPDLTRRAQGLIKAELRRVPQPEVQTVPQPAQRPAPEPKAPTSPLFTGEWKGSTQGSPRAGGPALFTVKHGEVSVYHDHWRVDGVALDPVQTSKGPALRGTARYPDGHSVTLVIDLSDRQGRGYGVWVAVKDPDGQIIEKQAGKVEPQQRDLNRTRGRGR